MNKVFLNQPQPNQADGPRWGTGSRFHVMVKPVGPLCNLNCDYCFYLHKKDLLSSQTHWRMSDEVLENFIQQYIEGHDADEVVFSWQGGEPTLLGLDFFEKVMELEKKHNPSKKTIQNDLQTNGLLLDKDWAGFLKKHDFLVGLSIDGPQKLHDKHRPDNSGQPTHERVVKAAQRLKRHGVPFNTLTTVNRDNAREPLAVYRFLRDKIKPRAMQFAPCVEHREFTQHSPQEWDVPAYPAYDSPAARPGNPESLVTDWSVDPEDYGDFLNAIFDEWYQHDQGNAFVYNFEYTFKLWLGMQQGVGCQVAPICGKGLAIEHDGNVYACDHLVYPKYHLGSISDKHLADLAFSQPQVKFGFDKQRGLPEYCRQCPFLFACNGECPKNRIIRTPVGEPGLNYLCRGLKKYFAHVKPYMDGMAADYRAHQRNE